MIVFIDGILVYTRTKDEHGTHHRVNLELSRNERLYEKFYKGEFLIREVQFLGHVVSNRGIHFDPSKIEAVQN